MNDPFQPTWWRALAALVIAIAAYFVPQRIPLEYFPLNNPSSGLQYLEITCAANFTGDTQIYLNQGRGFNELDRIQLPIGPSDMAFTYTFPLLDAPLVGIRLDPIMKGAGELRITNLRIINRREEEIMRFTKESMTDLLQTEVVAVDANSWKLVTKAEATDPSVNVKLSRPLVAEGMNERNLKRCLLSTGYLTFMLWLILLAIYFALRLFPNWRAAVRACAFLALLAFMFAIVGNRGLIKNSWYYAGKAEKIERKARAEGLPAPAGKPAAAPDTQGGAAKPR